MPIQPIRSMIEYVLIIVLVNAVVIASLLVFGPLIFNYFSVHF